MLTLQEPSTEPTLTLQEAQQASAPIQGEDARNRAARYHLAMGDTSPGLEALEHSIVTGQEGYLRQSAVRNQTAKVLDERRQKLQQLALQSASLSPTNARTAISELQTPVDISPDTIMENNFADRYMNYFLSINQEADSVATQGATANPEAARQAVSATQNVIARQQLAVKAYEDIQARMSQQGWGATLVDIGRGILPGVSASTMSPDWDAANIIAPGSSFQNERMKYWSFRTNEEADAWLRGRINSIAQRSVMDAVTYAKAIVSQSSGEKTFNDIIGAMDAQFFGSIAATAATTAIVGAGFRHLLGGAASAVADGTVRMEAVHAAAGDIPGAASIGARRILSSSDPQKEVLGTLHTLHNPNLIFQGIGAGQLEAEATQRVLNNMKRTTGVFEDAVDNLPRAPRVERSSLDLEARNALELAKLQHLSVSDSIVDARKIYDNKTNTWQLEMYIGKHNEASGFRTTAQADNYAQNIYRLDTDEYKVIGADVQFQGPPKPPSPRIEGFNSIQGTVRLKDGTEVKVSNRKDGIYQIVNNTELNLNKKNLQDIRKTVGEPEERLRDPEKIAHLESQIPSLEQRIRELEAETKINPVDVAAYKTSAKDSKWVDVKPVKDEPNIHQQGNAYWIRITKPFDETDSTIREAQTIATTNQNPVNVGNWFLGAIARSAEDQLAYFQRGNRHLMTHVPQEVQRVMAERAALIGKMRKADHRELERVLINNRDYIDYSAPEGFQRGRAYRTQAQLEQAWLDAHGHRPNEKQTLGYWTYHQLMDADWMMRNYGVLRDQLRQGQEQFVLKFPRLNDEVENVSVRGIFRKELPQTNDDYGIYLLDGNGTRISNAHKTKEDIENIERLLNNGYRVIQVANPADRPLLTATGRKDTINYVLTKDYKTTPLPFKQIDYAPGVHVMYPQQYFIKQPVVHIGEKGQLYYYGDKTIMAVDSENEAKRIAKAITQVQTMIKNNATDAELNNFITRNLPEDASWWKQKFAREDGLTMDQPIEFTFSGKSIYEDMRRDLRPSNLRNERNTAHNADRAIDMDFLANRNGPIDTISNRGSLEQPLWHFEPARTIDPFTSINRGLGNSIRNLYMNDYKIGAVEQWVQQYKHLFTDAEMALKNPFEVFYNKDRYLKDTIYDREALASANNTHARILGFLGVRSELGRDLNLVQQRMMNMIESLENKTFLGQTYLPKGTLRWYNDHELRLLKDPVAFTKSWMFDFKFGFFNIKQFLVQSQGFSHIMGVQGPVEGAKAFGGYSLMWPMLATNNYTPELLNRMANIATKFGMSKEHFLESFQTLRKTGFDIIGREHSLRDDLFDPQLFSTTLGNALEWGRRPFSGGERLVRVTAWNAAYNEWRRLNPDAVLDQFHIANILTKADDLSLNMTRASHSWLQEGWRSIPTQFYTFSHRLIEQFWGGRLTPEQKRWAFATHAMLYGVPVAVGGALIPYPVYEGLRKDLLRKDSPLLENPAHQLMMDGFLGYATRMITGKDYNVGQRYGPGFTDQLDKMFEGEISLPQFMTGATGTFVSSMYKSMNPFVSHIYLGLVGGQQQFPLTKDDLLGVLREISSVNDVHNAYYALNTGKYFSKAGEWVGTNLDATDAGAIMLGLTRRDISDVRLHMSNAKDVKEAQQRAMNLAEREIKRGLEIYLQDKTKAEVYFTRAKAFTVIGDLRDEQVAAVFSRAISENRPLVDRVREQFLKDGYKSELPQRLKRLFEQR